ncbi:MAG: hypothetical protein IJA97_01400 [Clostridia bacterium]|nr:hypothetical protein [Clostridia bacterium]
MENKAGEIEQATIDLEGGITSQPVETEKDLGEKESLSLGKFSSVTDLLNAYNSLQSEFTRRSQKIKELVRENESLKSEKPKSDSEHADGRRGKISFSENYPEAKEILPSLYELAASCGDEAEGFLERAYVKYLKDKSDSEKNYYLSDEYLLKTAMSNQSVKNGIIREYLDSVSGSKPKVAQFMGHGDGIVIPPSKPKTLEDASVLAKKILEKSKEITNL